TGSPGRDTTRRRPVSSTWAGRFRDTPPSNRQIPSRDRAPGAVTAATHQPTRAALETSCVSLLSSRLETTPQRGNGFMRVVQRARACRPNPIEATWAASANLSARANPRVEQAFLLEASQRCLNRAGGDITLQALFHLRKNGAAIGFFAESHDG